ncbi:MAG: glutamate racemase [Candidatus Gracilibacteria bacterium]|nr:glutamate racemase [Candidatus Gracilibacteria bacterium]
MMNMIGIFDSGFGGLSVLNEFRKNLGEYDYIYFGDSENIPYGDKDLEEIKELTIRGVNFLFDKGAKIVILACNTATSNIRVLQQEIFPDRKILGVTIPAAEKIAELGLKKVGVLATNSTVKSHLYKERVQRLDERIIVQEIGSPKLVPLIESGNHQTDEFKEILKGYLYMFDKDIEYLVLGCTHYSLVSEEFRKLLSTDIGIIDPSYESSMKFRQYLEKHSDIEKGLSKNGNLEIFTSGDHDEFMRIGGEFLRDRSPV